MGLKCKIELGPNQLPVAVTEQGNISPLFKGFLKMFSDLDAPQQHNKAIVYWTAASDERFQEYTGKNEDTAVVEDVIAYVQAKNMFDNELSASEEFEIKKMMSAAGVRSLGELAQKLTTIFPAGKIDTKAAIDSGIYTQEDINSLEIGKIIPVLDRIYGSIMKDKDFEVESKDTIETYRNSQEKSILDTSSIVTLSEVQEQLLKQVSDPRDTNEIERVLSEMPFDEIYDKFKEDQEFAKSFLEFFEGLRKLEVSSIVDGELAVESKRKVTMRNTFPVPETTLPFKAILEYIANIPDVVFTTSLPQVKEILTKTEEDFAETGVDIVGLKDLQDQGQIMEVLDTAIQALEQGQPDMLAEKLDEVFGEQDNTVIKRIDNEFDDITLVVLNTTLSPLEVFKRFGLIKLNSNIYQSISTTEDLQNAYNLLTERVQQGELEIPSPHKTYTSKKDTTTIQENLKTWMKTKDTGLGFKDERASLYQAVFKHKPLRDTTSKDILLLDSVNTRDEAYLTQDFISDFYSYILKEKIKDSTLYKDVLSKFDVTDNEITLNGDLISLDGIEFKQTLEDYIRLSKNPSLKHLVSKKGETQNNSNLTALNNKEAIAEYNQPMRKEGNYIVTKPNTADYIRKGQDVYEKVAQNKNGTIYGLVSPQENPNFYTTKYEVANDKKEIERLLRTADLLFKDTETFSQKERKAGMLTPFFQNLKRKAEGVFQVGQTQEQIRFQQDDLSQRAATPFSNLAGMTTAIGNAIKENPVTFNSDGRISGAYIDFKVSAQQQDKKESVSTPTSLPFLPNVLTLKHQVKEIEAKKDILENGFKIDMDTESPIPGVYLSSEDWGRMDRFGAIKGEEIYVDVNNEGLVYFDSVREFVDFLKSNDIPYQGRILTERHIQQLKDKGIKGILLREDFASQAKNELIIIDTNIITNTTTVKKEITKLPPSFSEHEDIARLYLDQKSKNITSEFTQAVEKYIKQPQLQIIGSNNALTTEDNKTLKQAQELSRRGASKEEIYSQTRWLQTNQGQWVREIGDLKFIPTNKEALEEDVEYLYNNKRAEYNLNEWFDFSEFKTRTDYTNTEFVVKYKESKENNVYGKATKSKTGDYKITVGIEGTKDFIGKVLGGGSYGVDTIRRFDDNGGASETTVRLEKSLESLVNHELQHILQLDGRRKVGNSPEAVLDYFARKNRSVIEKVNPRTYQELSEVLGKIYNKPNFAEYAEGLYRNSIGERQATEVERRLNNKEGLPEDFSGAYNIDITDMSSDELNFQIISERGAQNVEAYKESLDEAKRLEAQGMSLPEIENRTGWYKFQGQWRKMSQEALKDFTIKNNTANKVLTLKEVLGNENTIFTFYPEMDKIKVVFLDTTQPLNGIEVPMGAEQANGWYNKRDLTIFINRNLTENERHETYVLGHEVSHTIQETEGLPKGGWLDSVLEETKIILGIQEEEGPTIELYNAILAADKTNLTPNQQKIVQDSMITLLALVQGDRKTLIRQYRHIVGEIDAKVVEEALKARDRGNVTMNYSDFLKVWVIQENIDLNNVYLLGNGEVRFSIESARMEDRIGLEETKQIIQKLKQSGLSNNTYILTPQQIQDKLQEIGITDPEIQRQIIAWHGSPHSFKKFTTEAMGTGEGNQAFGWGLYFTDLKGIATNYAKALSSIKDSVKIEGGTFPINIKSTDLRDFTIDVRNELVAGKNPKDVAKIIEDKYGVNDENRPLLRALKSENVKVTLPQNASKNLYKVYLNKDKTPEQYTWLVWDKPVSGETADKIKQWASRFDPEKRQVEIDNEIDSFSEKLTTMEEKTSDMTHPARPGLPIRLVIERWDKSPTFSGVVDRLTSSEMEELRKIHDLVNERQGIVNAEKIDKGVEKLTGEQLYSIITKFKGNKKQASLFLLEIGIDGIKYPAESISRGATSDTARGFNYVVFDENAITIEEQIQFQKQLAENGINLTTTGFVYQGDVYLNEATLNPNTAIHEFNHLFTDWLKTNRPEIFNRGLELVNKEISKKNSDIQDTIDFVRRNQPNLTGENFALEVLTQLIGERGQSILESKKKTGLKSWLQDLWSEIKQLLGILDITPQQLSKLTLQEYADKMAIQLLKGETIVFDEVYNKARQFSNFEDFYEDMRGFRDSHTAPSRDDSSVEERKEQAGDFSLTEVAQGTHNVPDDFFHPTLGPRYYGYRDTAGMESLTVINNITRNLKANNKNPNVKAYRTIPKDVDVNELKDFDWVSLSKTYAIDHGESRFGENEYKLIEQDVNPNDLWWDGNDIREWGYDTGNTKKYSRRELQSIWEQSKKLPQFQIIGEKGASQLDDYEESSIRIDNLEIARQMEELLGLTPQDWQTKGKKQDEKLRVLAATGWQRNADLTWGYEIEDGELTDIGISYKTTPQGFRYGQTFLFEIYDNPTLYQVYPQLKTKPITFLPEDTPLSDESSMFVLQSNIHVNNKVYGIRTRVSEDTKGSFRTDLIHEIQHLLQEIEGFQTGGNAEWFTARAAQYLGEIRERGRTEADKNMDSREFGKMLETIINLSPNNKTGLTLNIEDIAKSDINSNIIAEVFGQDVYDRMIGETQARNVQERMNLTPEQRRETLFEDTEDVNREDQIFLRSGITGQQFAYVQKSIESQSLEKDFIQNSGFTLLSLAENQDELINEFDNCD